MSEIEIVGGMMEHYTQVPNDIFRTPGLKSRAVHVFGNLRSHRSGWKTNIRNVAESTGLSPNTVMAAINDLIDFGYIERVKLPSKGGKFPAYKYRVHDMPCLKNEDRSDLSQKVRREPYQKVRQEPVSKSETIKKNSSKKTSKEDQSPLPPLGDTAGAEVSEMVDVVDDWETIPMFPTDPLPNDVVAPKTHEKAPPVDQETPSAPGANSAPPKAAKGHVAPQRLGVGRVPDSYPPEFDTWWDKYPRKEKKRVAFKAWWNALKRTDLDTLNTRADQYAAWVNSGGIKERRYIPHPASWLNADAFHDHEQWVTEDKPTLKNENTMEAWGVPGYVGDVYVGESQDDPQHISYADSPYIEDNGDS